jgi:2-amino-4-hydroxy-6-hydroxymethyldihydropteridine diphosphokinase
MAQCLIALGSNLGERETILDSAIRSLGGSSGVKLRHCSRWHATRPVGKPSRQGEFLNGVAGLETTLEPDGLHRVLQQIERDHGRERRDRWDERTLDLDLLLYDQRVIQRPSLTLPHPRMSFRRFVLEPAVEIAAEWIHPTIGWSLDQLRNHLDAGANCLAIVSPSEQLRHELAAAVTERLAARLMSAPSAAKLAQRWPGAQTTWVSMPPNAGNGERAIGGPQSIGPDSTYPAADLPRLTVLLDPLPPAVTADVDAAWTDLAAQPGRGPTLRIPPSDPEFVLQEAWAAIESVWPGLCPTGEDRLE